MFARILPLLAFLAAPSVAQAPPPVLEPAIVEGRVELSPASADASARQVATAELRSEFARRGADVVAGARPFWLPGPVADLVLDRWLRRIPIEQGIDVVDRVREQRDHGGYSSYRTRLWVATDQRAVQKSLARLGRELQRSSERFVWFSGGTVAWWALCAFAFGWLDRLTRGYMPWRLGLSCVGMGVAVPGIALLFV